jgi:alpha-L-fucosidase
VGRNSVLLLNIPPDRRGLFHENAVSALMDWRSILDSTFAHNLIKEAEVRSSSEASGHEIKYTIDENMETYWTTNDKHERATLEYSFDQRKLIDVLLLQENIQIGQRIEKFCWEAWLFNRWEKVAEGTTVGYKRLIRFPAVKTNCVRLFIQQSRLNPTLANVGLFKLPEELIYSISKQWEKL